MQRVWRSDGFLGRCHYVWFGASGVGLSLGSKVDRRHGSTLRQTCAADWMDCVFCLCYLWRHETCALQHSDYEAATADRQLKEVICGHAYSCWGWTDRGDRALYTRTDPPVAGRSPMEYSGRVSCIPDDKHDPLPQL